MRLDVTFHEQNETFEGLLETNELIDVGFGNVQTSTYTERDYNHLINKPSINSIPLQGNLTSAELGRTYFEGDVIQTEELDEETAANEFLTTALKDNIVQFVQEDEPDFFDERAEEPDYFA